MSIKVWDLNLKEIKCFKNIHQGLKKNLSLNLILLDIDVINDILMTKYDRFIVSCSDDRSIKIHHFDSKKLVHHFVDVHRGLII